MFTNLLKNKAKQTTAGILGIVTAVLPLKSIAYDFELDGMYYNIINVSEVEVTHHGEGYGDSQYQGEISIPESITYDGNNYSVTSIGEYAFFWCDSVKSIIIPESVKNIGECAFESCRYIKSIKIPKSVTNIGVAFGRCMSLKSIIVDEENTRYKSKDGVLYDYEMKTLLCVPAGKENIFCVPESVTSIGHLAFFGCNFLTSIIIPESVTSISSRAFQECISITSFILPKSVTFVGEGAFYYGSSKWAQCLNPEPPVLDDLIDVAQVHALYVPDEAVEEYRASNWANSFDTIMALSEQRLDFFNGGVSNVNQEFTVHKNQSDTLKVEFDTTEPIIGFQMDITLPDCISITETSGNLSIKFASEELQNSHILTAAKVCSGNTYRIIAFSNTNAAFAKGIHALNIELMASPDIENGEIVLNNTILSMEDNNSYKANDYSINMVVAKLLYGDSNDDGLVAIDDVMTDVQYILEQNPQPFNFEKADINQDEKINIVDVTGTVAIILSNNNTESYITRSEYSGRMGSKNMTCEEVVLDNNQTGKLVLQLKDVDDVTGLQADIVLPEGISVTNVKIAGEQNSDHSVGYANLGNNHIRFVAYSLSSAQVKSNTPLIEVQLQGIEEFTEAYAEVYAAYSSDSNCELKQYNSISVKVKGYTAGVNGIITDNQSKPNNIYSLEGIMLKENANESDLKALTPGVYIIGGKKTLVK